MNNLQAEASVLGAIMLRNECFHDVAPLLSVDCFTSKLHRDLWGICRDRILAGEPADCITIGEANPAVVEGALDILSATHSAHSVLAHAQIVRSNWRRREASKIGAEMMGALRDAEDGAVDRAIGALLALNATQTECEFTGKQMLQMAWREAQAAFDSGGKLPGITTGLSKLDDLTGGLHDGDLFVVGARPGMGKTGLMVNMAEAAADAGAPVGVITAEQPAIQIALRRVALLSNVGATVIRSGRVEQEQWSRITDGILKGQDRPMWFYDRASVGLDELVGVARKWRHAHGIKALYVDYIQRIRHPNAKLPRHERVGEIAVALKNLGRDLDIPIVALSQVKADVESRPDKRPRAGDLANSDELTREADEIVMLYRDEVYNRDTPDAGIAELLVEKNRHGPDGFIRCAFMGPTMRFADLDPDWARNQRENTADAAPRKARAVPIRRDQRERATGEEAA